MKYVTTSSGHLLALTPDSPEDGGTASRPAVPGRTVGPVDGGVQARVARHTPQLEGHTGAEATLASGHAAAAAATL